MYTSKTIKKLAFVAVLFAAIGIYSCGNDANLSQQEEVSIEEQMERDQEAMDSLEKAIQAQLDSADFDSKMPTE